MWLAQHLFLISFLFGFCHGADYKLEINCTTEEQCNIILRAIATTFSNAQEGSGSGSGDGSSAEITFRDYNECEDTLNYCVTDSNTECSNVFRTYSCGCAGGYSRNASQEAFINCTDVNECNNSTLNNCSIDEQCVNLDGGYDCLCTRSDSTGEGRCPNNSTSAPYTESLSNIATEITTELTTLTYFEGSATSSVQGSPTPNLSPINPPSTTSVTEIFSSSDFPFPYTDSSTFLSTDFEFSGSGTTEILITDFTSAASSSTTSTNRIPTTSPPSSTTNTINQSTSLQTSTPNSSLPSAFSQTDPSTSFVEPDITATTFYTTSEDSVSTSQDNVTSNLPPTTVLPSTTVAETFTSTVFPLPSTTASHATEETSELRSTFSTDQSTPLQTSTPDPPFPSTFSQTDPSTSNVTSELWRSLVHLKCVDKKGNILKNPFCRIIKPIFVTAVPPEIRVHEAFELPMLARYPEFIETVASTVFPLPSNVVEETYVTAITDSTAVVFPSTTGASGFNTAFHSTLSTDQSTPIQTSTPDLSYPSTFSQTDPSTSNVTSERLGPLVHSNCIDKKGNRLKNPFEIKGSGGVPYTTTPTSVVDNVLGSITEEDILAGSVSIEDAMNIVGNLSILIESNVNESSAMDIVRVFDLFATSPDSFPPTTLVEITQLAERLLNTMILQNGSFLFREGQVAVAAVDINGNRTEPLQFSVLSGFDALTSAPPIISLPSILFESDQQQRISFTGYDNAGLFPSEGTTVVTNQSFNFNNLSGELIINSGVIGSALNGTEVMNLSEPINITIPIFVSSVADDTRDNSTVVRRSLYNPRCAFFNYTLNNGIGDWSTDGCVANQLAGTNDVSCQCNHLTSFAVLMSVETRIDDHILTILTYVGCSLSIFGLFASILTYTIFRHLRKHKSKQILLHFCLALSGVYIVYLFGITAGFPINQSQCTASGFFLHFFTSSTFTWMFIEVLDMYLMFVKVWNEISHPVKKACALGWGFPLLLSIATLSAHFGLQNRYPGQDVPRLYPEFRETVICWLTPTGLYWAFFLPMGIILTINLILFVIVLYHVTCKRANSKLTRNHSNSRRIKARQHILNAVAILLLTGPTWIIGFLINIDPISDGILRRVLSYIFVILNAFQGLWIFIVFTVRPQAVRAAWWSLFTGKYGYSLTKSSGTSWGRRMTKTSSTYLSRANKRKSSADIRRSSASSSVGAFKINSSGKLRKLEVDGQNEKTNGNTKQYRYTSSPKSNSSSNQSLPDRKDNGESQQNLVAESSNGTDNPTFNSDERSSTSSQT